MRKIEVVPYNPEWPQLFESEALLIQQVLGDNCLELHHIGSTSVPGLAAKPIIDIIPVVQDIRHVDQVVSNMEQLGYSARGENGMLFRRFFIKNLSSQSFPLSAAATLKTGSKKSDQFESNVNVHVFEKGTPDIDRHLKFRDWMRSHPSDREAYATLKKKLAASYPNDIMNYVFGKDAFVTSIDAKTGFRGIRITKALTPREWEKVSSFRQHYFFNKISREDPYTWTFEHQDHLHYLLYQGSEIVGYLHLQLWGKSRSALRIMVIDQEYQRLGLGKKFLADVERWLREQGIRSLHVQSSPEAHQFYLQQGYYEMPFNDPEGYKTDSRDVEIGKILN
ncbi:MAG: GNAT family N-acetyltransferase [Chthoniobacterales bacterium]